MHTSSLLLVSTISAAFLAAAANASVFLPVYSPKSANPLHVSAIDTNTMAVVKSWTFPAGYTGHRSACFLPEAQSNMTFVAWTGGETYNPSTDPFGTSRGYEYPMIDVTETSTITPRFDVWAAGTALYNTTNAPVSGKTEGNEGNSDGGDATELPASTPVRVRVVRWKVDGEQSYSFPFEPRVVFNRMMDPRITKILTEADFLDENTHDIDWEYFSSEVANSDISAYYPVKEAEYLVVLGEGPVFWRNSFDTNTWVTASTQVIKRKFNDELFRTRDVVYEPATNGSFGAISWSIELHKPNQGYYPFASSNIPPVALSVIYKDDWTSASARQDFMQGTSNTSYTFNVYGTFRMPPQSADGRWRWWPPSSFLVPGRVCGIYMGDAKHPPKTYSGLSISTNSTVNINSLGEFGFAPHVSPFCEIPIQE